MSATAPLSPFTRKLAFRICAVGAGLVELDEKPGADDPADMALEGRTDAVGEEMGDQPVGGLPLRRHGATLGCGNARRDLAQRADILGSRQAVVAEFQRADQGAVHDEIGVAADRRGEVGVTSRG